MKEEEREKMLDMRAQLVAMQSELEGLRRSYLDESRRVAEEKQVTQTKTSKMKAQVEELWDQRRMQEARMTEERRRWHAEAQTQKAQIEALRRKLDAQREQAGEQERVWKGQQQAWEEARTNLELELRGTQTERAHLEAVAAASKAHGDSLQHRVEAAEHELSKTQAALAVAKHRLDLLQAHPQFETVSYAIDAWQVLPLIGLFGAGQRRIERASGARLELKTASGRTIVEIRQSFL